MNAARHLVSQKKFRTVDKDVPNGAVDLDLTVIHPKLICMGYPASGFESCYRNSYGDALRYLDYKYGEHYVVYNLCKEKEYQYSLDKFHGRVRLYPFYDHSAAPLKLMPAFVHDAMEYINENVNNVVVIHCKAGKGRTGVMACCLLLVLEPSFGCSSDAVMKFYGERRTSDGRGLTVPSQRRSVVYYERLLKEFGGQVPVHVPALRIHSIRFERGASKVSLHAIKVYVNDSLLVRISVKPSKSSSPHVTCEASDEKSGGDEDEEDKSRSWMFRCDGEKKFNEVRGDVKLEIYDKNGARGVLGVSTLFMEKAYTLSDIDKLNKSSDPTEGGITFDFTAL